MHPNDEKQKDPTKPAIPTEPPPPPPDKAAPGQQKAQRSPSRRRSGRIELQRRETPAEGTPIVIKDRAQSIAFQGAYGLCVLH